METTIVVTTEEIMFVGVLVGVLGRTLIAWFQHEQEEPGFLKRYWASMAIALLGAFMIAVTVFQTVQVPSSAVSILAQFLFCIGVGWGANDMINKFTVDPLPKPSTTEEMVQP